MPAFHTHWLMALLSIESATHEIQEGKRRYFQLAHRYRKRLIKEVRARCDGSSRSTLDFADWVKAETRKWEDAVFKEDATNGWVISCFSAYMLGAGGPDLWTVPVNEHNVIPDTCGEHFDLGHYNRAHAQFLRSIETLANPAVGTIHSSAEVERSYFYGMAAHFGGDLVVHQLVNVSAGAYALLPPGRIAGMVRHGRWNNEQGGMFLSLWNTHNKVEHYWDSYIRYRYLGDYGPFWPKGSDTSSGPDDRDWFKVYKLPTVGYLQRIAKPTCTKGRQCVRALGKDEIRYDIEKALNFPWVVCDNILLDNVSPFVYERVADKEKGAYPGKLIYERAIEEVTGVGVDHPTLGRSEGLQLEFFASRLNRSDGSCSFNFLTFFVCPDIDRTTEYGWRTFYDLCALKPFIETALPCIQKLLADLANGYATTACTDTMGLSLLARFWNLDTGLGLRVQPVQSATTKEVITRLDFVHVFDEMGTGPIDYESNYDHARNRTEDPVSWRDAPGFPTYPSPQVFDDLESVCEEGHDDAYLDRIPLAGGNVVDGSQGPQQVQSACSVEKNEFSTRSIATRLNLSIRVGIADLKRQSGSRERVAMFFLADKKDGETQATKTSTHSWVGDESKTIACKRNWLPPPDGSPDPGLDRYGVRHFATRVITNMDVVKHEERKTARGEWDNAIVKDSGTRARNFAIGTGRKCVLVPCGMNGFNPVSDYEHFGAVSPTEFVFFSLYTLCKSGSGYFDAITKVSFSEADLESLKKIEEVNWVKLILVYTLTDAGLWNLTECWSDGLPVRIEPITSAAEDTCVDSRCEVMWATDDDGAGHGDVLSDIGHAIAYPINVVRDLVGAVVGGLESLGGFLLEPVGEAVGDAAGAVGDFVQDAASAVGDFFSNLFGGGADASSGTAAQEDQPGDTGDPYADYEGEDE